jgi:hypothetical protein
VLPLNGISPQFDFAPRNFFIFFGGDMPSISPQHGRATFVSARLCEARLGRYSANIAPAVGHYSYQVGRNAFRSTVFVRRAMIRGRRPGLQSEQRWISNEQSLSRRKAPAAVATATSTGKLQARLGGLANCQGTTAREAGGSIAEFCAFVQ